MKKQTITATQSESASKMIYITTAITGTALKKATGRASSRRTGPPLISPPGSGCSGAKRENHGEGDSGLWSTAR